MIYDKGNDIRKMGNMNQETKKHLKELGEKIIEKGIKTACPRCPSTNAEVIKTKSVLVINCDDCGFSMGSPREVKI
jgi:transcription elongation factor Elf1